MPGGAAAPHPRDRPMPADGQVDRGPLSEPDSGRAPVLLTGRSHMPADDRDGRIGHVHPPAAALSGPELDLTDPALPREARSEGRRDGAAWRDDDENQLGG